MVASITHSDTIRPSPMKFIYAPPGLNGARPSIFHWPVVKLFLRFQASD
jgi:hypothetical protein